MFLDPSKPHADVIPMGQAIPGEYTPHNESAPDSAPAPSLRGGQQEVSPSKLRAVPVWQY